MCRMVFKPEADTTIETVKFLSLKEKSPHELCHSQTRKVILKLRNPYGANDTKSTQVNIRNPVALIPYCLRKQEAWREAQLPETDAGSGRHLTSKGVFSFCPWVPPPRGSPFPWSPPSARVTVSAPAHADNLKGRTCAFFPIGAFPPQPTTVRYEGAGQRFLPPLASPTAFHGQSLQRRFHL